MKRMILEEVVDVLPVQGESLVVQSNTISFECK